MTACIKFVRHFLLSSGLLLGVFLSSQAQPLVTLLSPSGRQLPENVDKKLARGLRLQINSAEISRIWDTEPESFRMLIPMPGGVSKNLTFHKKRIVTEDFSVVTSDGRSFTGKEFVGVHYQVKPENGEEKVGTLSFTKTGLKGVFSDAYGNWNIGVLPEGKGDYVIFCERDLAVQSGFHCETEDGTEPMVSPEPKHDKSIQTSGTCRTVKVYFECDYKMYTDNGSNASTTSNNVTGMFNAVNQLYSNEQVDVEISQIYVWTATDPFAALTSANLYLLNFATTRTSFNGTIAHFLTTRTTSFGGLAYVNVICNSAARYAFSNIYNTYSALPTYSWTIGCVAHEMGHNFSSKHTHWCGWQLTGSTIGRIDSCYAGETVAGAINCTSTTKSNMNGTVMSYCHLNGAINFNRGFGPLPGNAIRNGFANASCVTGNPVPVFSVSGTRAVCEGGTVNLNTTTAVTGATFQWSGPNGFSSTLQNPVINSASGNQTGDYLCTVTKSSCTSDSKKVNVIVNQPDAPPLSEGFESAFPAAKWRIANPHNDRTWVAHTGQGGFGTSTKCIKFDNFSYPSPANRRDSLFVPVSNLSGFSGATLTFDVAYAWNGVYNDTLCVLVSSNCGRTFSRVYAKTRNVLATAPNATSAFTPTSAQWRKETIDLSAYAGQPGVQVAFVNISGWSNFIFLDNINITATGSGSGNSIALNSLAQSSFCPGATLSVGFTPSGTFNPGNTFTVQLSNSSGSFSSPTTIGSSASSPVSATIPAGTTTGTGYLIRIVSSNPSTTSGTSGSLSISPLTVSAGTSQTTCSNGSAITLTGSPSGGSWSGNGISTSGVFTPTAALAGTQTVTYTFSQNGCSNTASTTITVNTPPTVNAGSAQTTCSSTPAFTLTGFSPAGGTWSGPGVSGGGVFTPTAALIGIQTLTYTATSNGCSASGTRAITVSSNVTVVAGANQTVCSNDQAITLSGNPAGGTWSGSGVTAGGVFTPSSALVGNKVLTYTVTGTCGGNSQLTITVKAAPTVNAGLDQSFCNTDGLYTIAQGSPSGGTWTGTGVSGGTFDPNSSLGSHTLTYSVTQNGCTSADQVDFTVNQTPTVTVGADQQACAGSSSVSLTGVPGGGNWSGGGITTGGILTPSAAYLGNNIITYSVLQNGCSGSASLTFTINAVPTVNAGPDQSSTTGGSDITLIGTPAGGSWSGPHTTAAGVFSPSAAGQGSYTLLYSFTQDGCTATDELTITVLPAAIVTAGNDVTICESASAITLTGLPIGGTWTGNGVSPEGIFTPSSVSVGNHTLTYTLAGNGSDEMVVNVTASPVVMAGNNQSICSTASNFTLTGATPPGGTWSGTGISASGLVTTSQVSIAGSTFTYSINQSGCSASGSVVITAVAPPGSNAGANQNICKNAAPIQLNGLPVGGTWSGPGVSGTGVFDPSTVSSGAKTLTYTVTGAVAGCNSTDQVVISVFNIPTVSAGNDRSTCINSAPFQLSGTPVGGAWVGIGVNSSGLFTPNSGLAGVQSVSYTVIQNGCSNTSTANITVNTLPVVNAGNAQNICTNSSSFTLSGATPTGGTWSGASFVNASGTCTGPFTSGTYSLTYSVTENGCTATAILPVMVNTVPVVNAGNNRSVCSNGAAFTLTGFSPAGGIWSGNGVNTLGTFTPATALTGNQTLTYSVIQNGCTGSDQMTVTVKSIPAITTGANETACESGVSFKVNGYSPRGGKWTGPGIFQDSLFAPNSSLIGNQILTYTVTKNGCTNSAQKTITITPGNAITTGTFPNQICANASPVSFSGFTPGGGTWTGSGMAQNGLLTPASASVGIQSYTYKLFLNGCRDSVQIQSTIKSVPVVFAGPDISVCASGSPVALTNATPSGGIWSGSGVNDSGIFNPAAVTAGSIPLTYSYTENGCTGTDVMNAVVQTSPSVSAGNDKNICKNSVPVTLTGSPFGGSWTGNGVSSSGVFTPTQNMTGNITLTYSINENGCSGTDQVIVSITNAVAVTAGANETLCNNGNPVTMTGFSPAGGAWSGNGITQAGQFSPANVALGSHDVTYRVTKNNCTVESTKTIVVNAAPSPIAGPDQNICSNQPSAQLTGFSPAGGTWSGQGITAGGVFSPNANNAGLNTLTYTVSANGCSATAVKVMTVILAPVVDAGADATLCSSTQAVSMSGFFPSGGVWLGQNVSQTGIYTPVAGAAAADTLIYSVTQNGCTSTDQKIVFVADFPSSIPVVAISGTTACTGQTLPLSITLTNPENFSIQWRRNGNAINGAITQGITISQSGIYTAHVQLATCSTTTEPANVTFNAIPNAPTITQTGVVLTSSVALGNQWRLNGSDIEGATGQTYTVAQNGIYTVVLTTNSCTSNPSASIVFTENEEIIRTKQLLKFYPNPNSGQFTIEMEGFRSPQIDLVVTDALGKQMWTERLVPDNQLKVNQEIILPSLPAGMYWIQVAGGGKPILQKMIIQ